jgi:DHA2 family methylenomycin A resistance protein-like MFS transporter
MSPPEPLAETSTQITGGAVPSPLGLLLAVSLGLSMVQLDITVVNVALPQIHRELHTTLSGLQWVSDAYALSFSSLMLGAGELADLYGRKRVYTLGLVVFVLASLLCALSPSLAWLNAARVVQGVGAAALLPNSLAILRQAFVDARLRARAIGLWAGISGVALVAGPTLGGVLVDALGWRAIFWINLPVGLVALLLTARSVRESHGDTQRKLDAVGQVLATVSLAALLFALIEGHALGWAAPPILLAGGVTVLGGGLFVWWEGRVIQPLIPLTFFRLPAFTGANVAAGLMNFGVMGMLFAMSLFFQHVQGLSAAQAGVRLSVMFLPFVVLVSFGGRLVGRFGARWTSVTGLALMGIAYLGLVRVEAQTPFLAMAPWLLLAGLGLVPAMPAVVHAAIGAVPHERAGMASAVNNTARQAAGALGIALLGGFLHLHAGGMAGTGAALLGAALALLAGALIAAWTLR